MTVLPRPQDISPLDPDDFVAAYEYAAMVAEYELLEEIPGIGEPFLVPGVGRLRLTNMFDNRFGLAAARHFGNETEEFMSFMWRVLALLRILKHPLMKKYVRERSDHSEVYRAIFEVAAKHQLSDNYVFTPASFFAELCRVAKRMDEKEGPREKWSAGETETQL
jgi:hypothetical protein